MRVASGEPVAVIDLDHDSVAARGSRMHDAAGGGGVDFGAIGLGEIDARMQRETAEERIDAIAERRGDAGIAGKRHAQGHEGQERLEALGRRHVARDARERRVERGRIRIKVGWDIGAAHAAFAAWGRESFAGSSPVSATIAASREAERSAARSMAARAFVWLALDPVERAVDERKARRGVEILCGSRHTRRRERRVRGQGAQILPRLVDRVRLDGPRLRSGLGKRGVGARGVVDARAGRCRRTESLDCAERVGRVWGCGLAPGGQRGCAPPSRRARRRSRRAVRAGPAGT